MFVLPYYTCNTCTRYKKRIYFSYSKVIILTSLCWILLDTFIFFTFFPHCFNFPEHSSASHKKETDNNLDLGSKNKVEIHYAEIKETPTPEDTEKRDQEIPYSPDAPGEMGKPVVIPPEKEEEMKVMFEINQFNLMASDMISVNRSLPDYRSNSCQTKEYPDISMLPDTSVVIVFHNEAWSTLIRTIWSVINRSPRQLIKEIVLVDDASERDFLGAQLEQYLYKLPVNMILARMGSRSGLVRSRLKGVSLAKGKTITFLDAHCECSEGWLIPLLYQVFLDRKTVISPIIDVINDKTFEYQVVNGMVAGFDWAVNFDWIPMQSGDRERINIDPTSPIRTPTMAGGLLTIERDFFYEIGSYDDEMNIWGGENLEMSFRLWQCGSQVLISPCSHVAHVFRSNSPYTFPGGVDNVILKNQRRTVEVWMDDHKDFYYRSNPASMNYDFGNVDKRLKFRLDKKCESFKWYLTNIYPEAPIPIEYWAVGRLRNTKISQCIDTGDYTKNYNINMKNCFDAATNQVFSYNKDRSLQTSAKQCLEVPEPEGVLKLSICADDINQKWTYDDKTSQFQNIPAHKCLSVAPHEDTFYATIAPCDASEVQKWVMQK